MNRLHVPIFSEYTDLDIRKSTTKRLPYFFSRHVAILLNDDRHRVQSLELLIRQAGRGPNALIPANKTPRDIIGDENVVALKQAGYVVVRLSELSRLRANVKSALDILSSEAPRTERV
jgi:hypothetical protein